MIGSIKEILMIISEAFQERLNDSNPGASEK